MQEVYKLQIKPRAIEVTETEDVTFLALADYLMQAAYEHAFDLGVSFQQTFEQNLTWFLSRNYIEVHRYPKLNEKLTVRTWIANSKTKHTLRDFQMLTESGEVVCSASTSWLLFNFRKRRIVDHMTFFADKPVREERAVDYNYPKIPLPEKINETAEVQVRRTDLDLNRHVNNRVYLWWILETIPEKQLKNYQINKVEIGFKDQAFYKDRILIESEIKKDKSKDEIMVLTQITNKKSGKLLTKMVTYWIKK
jgi:medium-chain acyl-[acyl-carrier-protein] hydrolase